MHAVRTNRIHYHALLSLDARQRNGNIKYEQYTSLVKCTAEKGTPHGNQRGAHLTMI